MCDLRNGMFQIERIKKAQMRKSNRLTILSRILPLTITDKDILG